MIPPMRNRLPVGMTTPVRWCRAVGATERRPVEEKMDDQRGDRRYQRWVTADPASPDNVRQPVINIGRNATGHRDLSGLGRINSLSPGTWRPAGLTAYSTRLH